MYSTSKTVEEEISKDCRTFRLCVMSTDGSYYFDPERIFTASSTRQSTTKSDDIELGAICSGQWDIEIYGLNENILGEEFDILIYLADGSSQVITFGELKKYNCGYLKKLTVSQVKKLGERLGEPIPMGRFICVKIKKNGESSTVTFADRLYFSDKAYVPQITFPASFSQVEADILSCLKLENGCTYPFSKYLKDSAGKKIFCIGGARLKTKAFYFEIESIPESVTMRQMLSYIASAMGQCGFVDRSGKYVRKWYDRSTDFYIDDDRISTPTINGTNVIAGLKCKVDDNTTLVKGQQASTKEGRVIEFENPYMTDELLGLIFKSMNEKGSLARWRTAEIDMILGDPRIDIMDTADYGGALPVTSIDFNYDGGLSAQIKSAGRDTAQEVIE